MSTVCWTCSACWYTAWNNNFGVVVCCCYCLQIICVGTVYCRRCLLYSYIQVHSEWYASFKLGQNVRVFKTDSSSRPIAAGYPIPTKRITQGMDSSSSSSVSKSQFLSLALYLWRALQSAMWRCLQGAVRLMDVDYQAAWFIISVGREFQGWWIADFLSGFPLAEEIFGNVCVSVRDKGTSIGWVITWRWI